MPKISAKRQITLPIEQCKIADIGPGDEYDSYIDNHGHITIIKKSKKAAEGILNNIIIDKSYTDEESLQSVL